jgi:protein O-mannosyl-transferase
MSTTAIQKYFRSAWLPWITVIAAAAVAFIPVLSAGYVQWDDVLLTNKLALRGTDAEHLRNILLPGTGAYQPLRDLYFLLIYRFSGFNPFGYHLANWVLYLAVTALAMRSASVVCRRAGCQGPELVLIPWLTGLLFALHPLHVEVVAWMQGNKDLLATAFCLGTFLCWEKFTRQNQGNIRYYIVSLLLFLLALGSKPSAVSFPLVLLTFDLLFSGEKGKTSRSTASRLVSLIPRYLPILIPAALLTLYFVLFSGALDSSRVNAGNFLTIPLILLDYYRLLLLPVGLNHRYFDPVFSSVIDPAWLAGLLLTTAIACLAWRLMRKQPLAAFGIAWFYICWLPQSNLFPIAIRVADRYVFLSILGLSLTAASAIVPLLKSSHGHQSVFGRTALAGSLLAVILGSLSWNRCLDWHDGVRLWSDAVEQHPGHSFYHYGLAGAYREQNNLEAARREYSRAAEQSPDEARNWISLAYMMKQAGELDDAEISYKRALKLDPGSFNAVNNLGNIYSRTGRDSLALDSYTTALAIRPGDYMATFNLSQLYRKLGNDEQADSLLGGLERNELPQPVILLRRGRQFIEQGRLDSAMERFQRAVELDRNLMPAWAGLGEVYLRQDSTARAIDILRRVLENSEPDWSLLNNMALAFERTSQPDSALAYYRLAYRTQPDSTSSTLNLAVNLNRRGSRGEAIGILRDLLRSQPDNFPALRNLGNWLALDESHKEAALCYGRALKVNPGDSNVHYNLGRLYLQFLEQRQQALHHLKESLRLDPTQQLAPAIRQVIEQLETAATAN